MYKKIKILSFVNGNIKTKLLLMEMYLKIIENIKFYIIIINKFKYFD